MPAVIPKLRKDLEVHHRTNGTVDIRDPFLLQIYTLDAGDYEIAKLFDGTVDLATFSKQNKLKKGEVKKVEKEFRELKLLDTPDVWTSKPMIDNVQPYSQIDTKRGLKVLPVADETAHWTCHGCGVCCHGLAVEINKEEESRIDASLYQDILKGEHFAEDSFLNPDEGAKRTLKQVADDNMACIFLAPDGLCYVHARQGMRAKPDACQMFPAMIMMIPGQQPRIGLRTNCSSMYKSFHDGPPVKDMIPHVMGIVEVKGEVHQAPKKVKLFGRSVSFERFDSIPQGMRKIFADHGINADSIMMIDKKFLGGRVKKSMKGYGRAMLAYIKRERSGPAPVEEGAYAFQIDRLKLGKKALMAMKDGKLPPPPGLKINTFLRAQMNHSLYIGGALNLPDAGYALVGQMLALLALLHSLKGSNLLKTANTAFEVFMMPLLETMEHSWPILDAVNLKYAEKLREELAE